MTAKQKNSARTLHEGDPPEITDEWIAEADLLDGNKVVRRPIKVGIVTASGITVTEGLTGTERVVLRAGGFLAPGDKVIPQTAKAS